MKKTLLSVIVPAYNCETYIAECLQSVLSQMPENCELIVVDDGSTDATPQILETYGRSYPNVRIFIREHKGASGARNAGLFNAKGEYVTFLDCDDCLAEHFLEKALPLLMPEEHTDSQDSMDASKVDLFIFGIERIFLSGSKECWSVPSGFYPTVSDFADEYIRTRALLIYSNCNKFYRRSVIEKLSLNFQETLSFGEDRLFNYRFLTGCRAVCTSSLIMLHYIQRSKDSMSTKSIPHYFETVKELHSAKIKTFLSLSQGTNDEERRVFCARDLGNEIMQTVDRFTKYPMEEKENLPLVNSFLFDRFPSLASYLSECGISDPACWYQSQAGKQFVIDFLRRTAYKEKTEEYT